MQGFSVWGGATQKALRVRYESTRDYKLLRQDCRRLIGMYAIIMEVVRVSIRKNQSYP